VTVPHGLRLSWAREQRTRELVEAAVVVTDLGTYAATLTSVDQADWLGCWSELVLRVGVPIVPERVARCHAKARALAVEDQRRRRLDRQLDEQA
jgi:hypothetical protein